MCKLEQVIRQLEDFILAENDLFGTERIPFEHHGKMEFGYSYIRSANTSFQCALVAVLKLFARPISEIRFLEAGCGLGTKCEIARLHGMQATGFDLKIEYVELAQRIFRDCSFVSSNVFDFDYSQFDLVYYHVPFFEDKLLFQLEIRILTQLPVGSVLFVTRFSDQLRQSIYEGGKIKPQFSDVLFDPGFDLGRICVLQKRAEVAETLLVGPRKFEPESGG